jgi:hypothetical protein
MAIPKPLPVAKVVLMFLQLLLVATIAQAQTSSFTYQGRFTDGGTAATGLYDMQFKLFDGGGTQIGSTITNNAVSVTSGVFTVQLDYGSAAFPGADRFLEIGVRPTNSPDAYTVLAPRQHLTSTPYAIRSATADTATNATQLNGNAANQYVLTNDSRLTDSRAPAAGSANYIQNTNTPQLGANFFVGGNGTANGTLTATFVNATTHYRIGGIRILSASDDNIFAGVEAGLWNSTGFQNSYFGWHAGRLNSSGFGNSFFGILAGAANTTGTGNSFFGSLVGDHNTTGNGNSFFGREAGRSNTIGSDNAFFGTSAGYGNTSGTHNSFFGRAAGIANEAADNNSFFGYSAGGSNVTGFNNSFFGAKAGTGNISGFRNAFFGFNAGSSNNSAESNSFFGANSGEANSAGQFNSFFGSSSGLANTTGSNNSFFGDRAGNANTTASDSAYFGFHAGTNSTGAANSFFGSKAGINTLTGFANSFVGTEAGNLNSTGFSNTFLGRTAGASNTSGNNNTVVGALADVDSGNLSFATAIGAGAHVSTSNTIVVGRSNSSDEVRVPGTMAILTLGSAGFVSLCRNAVNQISTCSSSLRYKKDLQPFTRGLALLNTLKPITFRWKADNSPDLGFGAEDIAAVEPLLVTRNDKGEVEGVKYDRITAVLVNAVKEQQEQIKEQQRVIASLKQLVCRRNRAARVCK